MTGYQTLIARGTLGIAAATFGLAAASLPHLRRISQRSFDRLATGMLVLTRLGLYWFTFFAMRLEPRGDIPSYYFQEALEALHGHLPYRDFPSSYAPLHPYLDGAVLLLWHSPLAIILLAIVVECLLFPLWLGLARGPFSEQRVRTAAVLYVFSPVSLQYVGVDGQDNVIVAAFLALALYFLCKRRAALSGGFVAAAIALVKFLPLLYVPAFFLAAGRRVRWVAGFAFVLLLGYGGFALRHVPLLYPLAAEGAQKTAGNLPYLIEATSGIVLPSRAEDAVLLLSLVLILGLVAWVLASANESARTRVVTFAMAALTLDLVLLSKKSWPAYLMLALFPICLSVTGGRLAWLRLTCFQLFSVVAVVEHSYWASLIYQWTAPQFHGAMLGRSPLTRPFLALQVLLIAGYVWLLCEALTQIARGRGSDAEKAEADYTD